MRRWLTGLVLLAAVVTASAEAKDDSMIYPRGTAPAGSDASSAARAPGTLSLLGVAAIAAAAGWWLWRKRRHSLQTAGGSHLAIVETKPLGSRQYLVIADYDGRKFLLGVCPGSIELLTPLDGGTPPRP